MSITSEQTKEQIQYIAELMRKSKRAIALTGAGISTPSGIPDFRSGGTGLWNKVDPEIASLNTFRYAPERFFAWIRPLIARIVEARPNHAHLALARLEQAGRIQTIITQNIDGLHQKAGSTHVLETHGGLQSLSCTECFRKIKSDNFIMPFVHDRLIPRCPDCGAILKPDVILFGEQLPHRTWMEAVQSAQTCDLMLVVGSSLEVLPVAGLPLRAVECGAHLIIVNQSPTYLDVRADVAIQEDVADVIPAIAEYVLNG